MRRLLIIAVALTSLGVGIGTASAKSVRIGVLVSNATLRIKCVEAHGVFMEGSTGYSCDTFGPSGGANVSCDKNGSCTGTCSRCVKAPTTVSGALKLPPVSAPLVSKGGMVTTTVNGNTTIRDHRNGTAPASVAGGPPPAAAPGAAFAPLAGTARAAVRDHRVGAK